MSRVALVTGASAGLGRATADLLAARGWTVVGASRRGAAGSAWSGIAVDVDVDASVAAAVERVLAEHGRIVVLSSIGGVIGVPFQAYYSASKFALEGWAEAMAYEVAPLGVHVTLVQPGNFATDFTDSRRRAAAHPGPYEEASRRAVAVMEQAERRGANPREVAQTIARQLEATNPRRRVSVGKPGERLGLVAKRVLPHAWFERVAKDSLGVK